MIPPHIWEEIAKRGTSTQRQKALRALSRDQTLRAQRAVKAARALAEREKTANAVGDSARLTHDAQNNRLLPGLLVRQEGTIPLNDPEVDLVHDYTGGIRDFLLTQYGRHSMDNQGIRLVSSIRWDDDPSDPGYGNAMMNGEQTAYGAGDEFFFSFAQILDIPWHEWTHMLTMYTANLDYWKQQGAGNEGFSDRFGMVGKQYTLGQDVTQADWLVGAGIWKPQVANGKALRSFKLEKAYGPDPVVGEDPQPKHYRDRYTGLSDNGGVHINSGIVNHAAYRTALEIGGRVWEKTAKIWFAALITKLSRQSDFYEQAWADYSAAIDLFGTGSLEAQAVKTGYSAVGLPVDGTPAPEPVPDSPCPPDVRAAFATLMSDPDVLRALNKPEVRKLYAYGRARAQMMNEPRGA